MTQETATLAPESGTGSRQRWIVQGLILAILVAFLGLLAYGLRYRSDPGPQIGQPAPPFTLTLFDGGQLSLEDLRGKVVVVNFWASWCLPCREEAPLLERAWREYKDQGVVFVGINYVDTEPKARAYMREFDVTYPNGPDLESRISRRYRIQGVPETFFIDKQGRIAPVLVGDIESPKYTSPIPEDVLIGTIERLLAEETP